MFHHKSIIPWGSFRGQFGDHFGGCIGPLWAPAFDEGLGMGVAIGGFSACDFDQPIDTGCRSILDHKR